MNVDIARGATTADLAAAIGKRSPSEQAAIIGLLNSYTTSAVAAQSSTDVAAKAKNANLAKLIFTTSTGQLLTIGSIVQGSVSKDAVTNVANGESQTCSNKGYAEEMVAKAGGGPDAVKVEHAIARKAITRGSCGTQDGVLALTPDALRRQKKLASILIKLA